MHMVATPNYTALDSTNAKEKVAAMYKKKNDMYIVQYFVILITGNWTKVFLHQRIEMEFFIGGHKSVNC